MTILSILLLLVLTTDVGGLALELRAAKNESGEVASIPGSLSELGGLPSDSFGDALATKVKSQPQISVHTVGFSEDDTAVGASSQPKQVDQPALRDEISNVAGISKEKERAGLVRYRNELKLSLERKLNLQKQRLRSRSGIVIDHNHTPWHFHPQRDLMLGVGLLLNISFQMWLMRNAVFL